MRKTSLISFLAVCAVLVLNFSILGCGDSNNIPAPAEIQDLASVYAGRCTDTCTTIMVCAQISEEKLEENISICEGHCTEPEEPEAVPVFDRDRFHPLPQIDRDDVGIIRQSNNHQQNNKKTKEQSYFHSYLPVDSSRNRCKIITAAKRSSRFLS